MLEQGNDINGAVWRQLHSYGHLLVNSGFIFIYLVTIQVFNHRRAGETERILINFKTYECVCGLSSRYDTSKQSNKAHNYIRFTIRKLNRTVSVLLQGASKSGQIKQFL